MKTQTQHTPTTWHIKDLTSDGFITIGPLGVPAIALLPGDSTSYALQIIHAVNTHNELINALRSAIGYLAGRGEDPKVVEVFSRIVAKAEGK